MKRISVVFYQSDSGSEPVKDWLRSLLRVDMKAIGENIKTIEYGWPLGMPVVRKLEKDLWEVRNHIPGKRIARVVFTLQDHKMILLHGFIKKSQKMPNNELKIARQRLNS